MDDLRALHIDQNGITENERKLYQNQIDLLKAEVAHLKEMLSKVLK
jgi:RNA polymerase-interacting CarD/CdnL/TRCF family regulator